MKKKFIVFPLLFMVLWIVNSNTVMARESSLTRLEVNVGRNDGEVTYKYDVNGNLQDIPQSFDVYDNKIFIVDSVDKEILVYEKNNLVNKYDTDFATYVRDIKISDNIIYLLDEDNIIYSLNMHDNQIKAHKLEMDVEAYQLTGLSINGNKDIVYQDETGEFDINGNRTLGHSFNGSKSKYSTMNETKSVVSDVVDIDWETDNTSVKVIGVDDIGNTYISSIEEIPNSHFILLELTIRKYNNKNEEVGIFRVPLEDYISFPLRHEVVTNKGDVYIMQIKSDTLIIENIDFGKTFVSRIPQLKKQAMNYSIKNEETAKITSFSAPSRTTVMNRANAMINLVWTRNEANMINKPSGVTMPTYLENYGPGLTFTGIPYTWAGFDGIDTFSSTKWTSYTDAMAKGAFAGNINATGNYKQNTAGLDCSGFISSAIELGYKTNTYGLMNLSTAVNIGNMLPMDIFVNADHVLFLSSWGSNDTVYTKETTVAGGIEKTKNYSRTKQWLSTNNYSSRTFW